MEELSMNMEMQEETAVPAIVAGEAASDVFAGQLAEMDRRLREMEAAIGDLRTVAVTVPVDVSVPNAESSPAAVSTPVATSVPVAANAVAAGSTGRKTFSTYTAQMQAKQGVAAGPVALHGTGSGGMDLHSVDAALSSLSVEQRIAVKSQMLRSGLLG